MESSFLRMVQQLVEPDRGHVLLAVSGGVDSMVMAHLFLRWAALNPAKRQVAVAHFNFKLRGQDSDADQSFVEAWCRQAGIPCYMTAVSAAMVAQSQGVSVEMAARTLRYRWFAQLCRTHGFNYTAVAHNANDQAETLLLHLLRGSGLRGLCGMQPQAPMPECDAVAEVGAMAAFGTMGEAGALSEAGVDALFDAGVDAMSEAGALSAAGALAEAGTLATVSLIRPLLGVSRASIEAYASAQGIAYRTDATNAQTEYARNKIRHLVMPVLAQISPGVVERMCKNAQYMSQAQHVLDQVCEKKRREAASPRGFSIHALLQDGPVAYWTHALLEPYGFNPSQVTSLATALERGGACGMRFYAPHYALWVDRTELIIQPLVQTTAAISGDTRQDPALLAPAPLATAPSRQDPAPLATAPSRQDPAPLATAPSRQDSAPLATAPSRQDPAPLATAPSRQDPIQFTPTIPLPSLQFQVADREAPVPWTDSLANACLDADKVAFPLTLRPWRQGDWFVPLGMKGRKKISDFLTDCKVPLPDKPHVHVLCSGDDIVWVVGWRIDNRYKVTSATRHVLFCRPDSAHHQI